MYECPDLPLLLSMVYCAGCGLYVLSVDDNPAKSDGRLRPGDEVIEVSLRRVLGSRPLFQLMAVCR